MKLKILFFSILIGVAIFSGWKIPLQSWIDINNGLLAFFGLLSAAIIQVIPVTANFLQSDNLSVHDAKKISGLLHNQQCYWLTLFVATILTVILIITISALSKFEFHFYIEGLSFSISQIFSSLLGLAISYVLLKMTGLIQGVLSLQRLRTTLVIEAAQRIEDEKERQRNVNAEARPHKSIVPEDYGNIIEPH